jgi:hypothetical protein
MLVYYLAILHGSPTGAVAAAAGATPPRMIVRWRSSPAPVRL